jgi:hypothetical protein
MYQTDRIIQDYTIESDGDDLRLAELVKSRIREGWQPYGPPFTWSTHHGSTFLCQAVVRYTGQEQQS